MMKRIEIRYYYTHSHDIIDGEFTRINYDEKNDYRLSVQTVRV